MHAGAARNHIKQYIMESASLVHMDGGQNYPQKGKFSNEFP
jgi:hypothetical protein